MKFKASYIIAFLVLFISISASAQVDRRIGNGQYKRNKHDKQQVDPIENSARYLKKELKLDDFQAAAILEILEDERRNITALQEDKGMTADEIRDRAMAISDRVYKKVLPLLTKEQAEIYTKMEKEKKF